MAAKKQPAKKVNDVSPPSKVPATPTSRPVIVTNHGIIKDPMVAAEPLKAAKLNVAPLSAPELPVSAAKTPVASGRKVIEPLSVDEKTQPIEGEEASSQIAPTSEQKPEVQQPAPAPMPLPDKPIPASTDLVTGTQNEALADTKEAEGEAERDKQFAKYIEDKTYFLPINTIEKRRSRRVVVVGVVLSIVLVAAWLNIALDAGLVSLNGLQPLTHFF